jgi:hypothetical protein
MPLLFAFLLAPILGLWIIVRGHGDWVRYVRRIAIKADADTVFALLDPGSPHSRFLMRGDTIETLDSQERRYRLVEKVNENEPIILLVTQYTPRLSIAIATRREDSESIGALAGSAERYDLEANPGQGCRVTLTANFQLLPKLNPFARAFHELLLQAAMASDLRKL